MKKSVKILAITALSVTVFALGLFLSRKKENPDELTLYGNVEIRQVDLSFRVGGKIEKMYFEEGDFVKKGELLAILDDSTYVALYEKTKGQVEANKASAADALQKYNRNIALCQDETVSKQDCETLLNNKNNTQGMLEASLGALKASNLDIEDTKIFAPNDGIITTRVQEPGSVVASSQPVYTLSKTKPAWIRAYISETDLANIRYGMEGRVLTDTIDPTTNKRREYTAWVGYISPVAEFTPKTVQTEELRTDLVYRIRVYVYDVDPFLRQGMPTTIKLNLKSEQTRQRVEDGE